MKIHKLEAIRGFAALYVVIHHFIGFTILKSELPAILRFPFRFGQEAVILFFLMSGFVIYLSSIQKTDLTFKYYFSRRFIRIYPIAFCAFFLSVLIALINGYHFTLDDVKELLGNILMLQDTYNKEGAFVLPFLQNYPLWSLSYEWWFYMFFYPLFIFFYKKQKTKIPSIYFALIISIAGCFLYNAFPNHLFLVMGYFVMWWAGVSIGEVYIRDKKITFQNMIPVLISIFIMIVVSSVPIIQSYMNGIRKFSYINYPGLVLRSYLFTMFILLAGIVWYRYKLVFFDFIFGQFERFAAISYAIYIIHFPFIWLEMPVDPYVAIFIKIILIFVLSYLLEIKMQPFINSLFRKKIVSNALIT